MLYMLDTNICIYIIKQKPKKVLQHFLSHQPGDISISSITLAELEYGIQKSQHKQKNLHALEEFILPLEICFFNDQAAKHYGNIRALLEKKGQPIGALDMLIAAHARSQQSTLITNNKKEFSRVPKLTVENWLE